VRPCCQAGGAAGGGADGACCASAAIATPYTTADSIRRRIDRHDMSPPFPACLLFATGVAFIIATSARTATRPIELRRADGVPLRLSDNKSMTMADPARAHHDMGGLPAGPVKAVEHDYALWEKRVDAVMMLLSHKDRRLITVDELRRNIESLGPDAYDTLTYYERWIYAITQTLIQRGVITVDELGHKIEAIRAGEIQAA